MKIFNDFLYKELNNKHIPYKEYIMLIADKKCFNTKIQLSRFYVEECAKLKFINIFDIINEQLAKTAATFFETELTNNKDIEYFAFKKDIPVSMTAYKSVDGTLIYSVTIIYNEFYKV